METSQEPTALTIVCKVRKLLALAHGGGTEAEAQLAAERAHALLAAHNLTLADVSEKDRWGDRVVDRDFVDGSRDLWPADVWHATAALYFCEYFYTRIVDAGRPLGLRHNVVGRKHSVRITKLMAEYLVDTINRLAREHGLRVQAEERRSYRHSFRIACARRLSERLWERRRATEKSPTRGPSDTTLPALASLYTTEMKANRAMMDDLAIRLGHPEGGDRLTHAGGADAGAKAADQISLNPQLTADGPPPGRSKGPFGAADQGALFR